MQSLAVRGRAPSVWALAWRALWRHWRAGELRLLALAVALAVAALSSVGFFADRIGSGLQRDARQLLGGDAALASDHAAPPDVLALARELGLSLSQTLSFPTMARAPQEAGGATRLVALKAVDAAYPLRGALLLADGKGAQWQAAPGGPAAGEVWVDEGVLGALGLSLSQTLWLGESSFRIAAVIAREPDRGAGFMNFAPRVMLRMDELASTGLVQPASRITHRLAVAGPAAAVARFSEAVRARIEAGSLRGARLESLESGRPEMTQTLGRAEKFLSLVALLAALLSAVAVALASRSFAQRHLDDCAMLRVLGLSQARMAAAHALQFVTAGFLASAAGVALGWAVHHGFVALLGGLLDVSLPAPGLWPVALGLGLGLTLLVAFGLPPLLQLAQVPPLRVIRRELGGIRAASAGVLALGLAGFAALLLLVSRDGTLGLLAVGGFGAAVGVFAALAWAALALLGRLVPQARAGRGAAAGGAAPRWLVLATRQLVSRPAAAVVQVAALAVGLMALVLLVLLRTDLVDSWRAATPPDAPNRFVINIQPEQAREFEAFLQAQGVLRDDWYPMVRGRLVHINDEPVQPERFASERARRLVDREFNLSFTPDLPPHNLLHRGRWTPHEAHGASVEEGLAQELGLELGDRIGFDMAGVVHQATVTSIRKVDWASMRVNFFVLFPVAELPDAPQTFISAFRVPADAAAFDRALLQRFPNVTAVDTSSTIAQVQQVLKQVIQAVELLFAFTLAAGLVVLLAALSASQHERERELAILRALGASSALLRQVQRAELVGVGLLAGALAAVVALAVGWALARWVFEFAWQPSPWIPAASALAGAALAWLAGWWVLRPLLRTPVVQTLRRAAG